MIRIFRRRAPAVIACGVALVAAAAGCVAIARQKAQAPVDEASLFGLRLFVDHAQWLHDQMDHGKGPFASPPAMTPDLPESGQQRFSVELTLVNVTAAPQTLRAEELVLRAPSGDTFPARFEAPEITLGGHQALGVYARFDVSSAQRALELEWERRGERIRLLTTNPATHLNLPPPQPRAWPKTARGLPAGDADEGAALFMGKLACFACHGDPGMPGTNTVAPALARIAELAAGRVPGVDAREYLYASLLEPNAFIAPECGPRRPCATPSAMPAYGEVVSPQEMADLIEFLSSLGG